MNVGVERRVIAALAVDDSLRLLAGGGVVEVDERLAVNGLLQDRKILAQAGHVEAAGSGLQSNEFIDGRLHDHAPGSWASGNRLISSASSRARSGAISARRTISSAKAKVSRLLAAASSIPRERR